MGVFGRLTGRTLSALSTAPDCSAARRAADWRDEMTSRSYRTTVGRLIWQLGMATVLALSLLATLALVKRVYMVQEALVGMLLIAISVAVVLFLLVGFVLFQAGIRQAILWITTGTARLAKLSHRHVTPTNPIVPPPFQR
jgi:hypothetical protein